MDLRAVLPLHGEDCLGVATVGVAIGGFMGTGKSTVGAILAQKLSLPFVDMDDVLTGRFGPIADQFSRDGEVIFRDRERALVRELADGVARVVSTGGGVWVDRGNRALLATHYRTVVLTAPLDVLRKRLREDRSRPLWDDAVRARFFSRREAYADADLHIDVTALDPPGVVASILKELQ